MFNLIVATDLEGGISKNNIIPWSEPEDLKHFYNTTIYGVVIMGRRTWDSIPTNVRPLPKRVNIVLSRKEVNGPRRVINEKSQIGDSTVVIFMTYEDCLVYLNTNYLDKQKFVIGGSCIYNKFINDNLISKYIVTTINNIYNCDQYLYIGEPHEMIDGPLRYQNMIICEYSAINHEENQFLDLIRNIKIYGKSKVDRTGVGTVSIFSPEPLVFDLSKGHIPLMTTRKLSLRIIFEELMWILRGQTDNKILNEKKIHKNNWLI